MVDAMLVERAAGGNMDAFGQIYEIIYPKAVKYVESMSKDAGAAEQVVQDTVVYFMQDNCKALKGLQDYSSFEPYFFQAVKNRYFNLYKSKRTKSGDVKEVYVNEIYDVSQDGELDNYFGVDQTMTPEQYAEHEEIKEILTGMIDELPDTQKEAFNLFVIGDMKQVEIAKVMDVPLNTVKSYLQYAKKKLSAKIEEYEKKNDIKLHSVLPILPFLRFMYGSEKITLPEFSQLCTTAGVTGTTATAAASATGTAGAAVTETAAATAVTAVAAKAGAGIATKVIAGIVVAAVVGTGAVVGPKLLRNDSPNTVENDAVQSESSSSVMDTDAQPDIDIQLDWLEEKYRPETTCIELDANFGTEIVQYTDEHYAEMDHFVQITNVPGYYLDGDTTRYASPDGQLERYVTYSDTCTSTKIVPSIIYDSEDQFAYSMEDYGDYQKFTYAEGQSSDPDGRVGNETDYSCTKGYSNDTYEYVEILFDLDAEPWPITKKVYSIRSSNITEIHIEKMCLDESFVAFTYLPLDNSAPLKYYLYAISGIKDSQNTYVLYDTKGKPLDYNSMIIDHNTMAED